MRRRQDLVALGRDTADLALRLANPRTVTPIGDDERRIVLASIIQAILATGLVKIEDVLERQADDVALAAEAAEPMVDILRRVAAGRGAWCDRLFDLVVCLGRDRQPSEAQLDVARAAIAEFRQAFPGGAST